jgi:cytochrome c556
MNGFAKLSVVAVCALAGASAAPAQDNAPTPEQVAQQATELRQGLLKAMGWVFTGHVGGMMRNKAPFDAAVAQKSAERVREIAEMLPEAFQFDTRKFQVKTRAKEAIWSNQADFASKADELQKAAVAMEAAAKGGDKAATLQAATTVGKACGACHDNYREK